MAEEADEHEDDSNYESDDDSEDTGSIVSYDDDEELYSEYALLGLRLFTARIHGEEQDPEDINMNQAVHALVGFRQLTSRIDDNTYPVPKLLLPTQEYVTEQLQEKGVTIYQLVSALMLDHMEYDGWETGDDNYNDITTKIREIIDNFKMMREPVMAEQPTESINFDQINFQTNFHHNGDDVPPHEWNTVEEEILEESDTMKLIV
jgi:hypothetical protein